MNKRFLIISVALLLLIVSVSLASAESNGADKLGSGDLKVFVNWIDDDAKGLRPDSITFDVYSGDALIDTLTVTSAQGWLKESSALDGDVRIVAHNVQGYSSSVFQSPETGFTITYTSINDDSTQPDKLGLAGEGDALSDGEELDNDKIEELDEPINAGVKVTKVWKDNDNADGKRPTSVNASYTIRGDGPNPFEITESEGVDIHNQGC